MMLKENELRWKHPIWPEVVLEMVQLISGFKAFHYAISKMKFGIQDVISSYSLNQFLISSTP